ncbi:MerR family transcriptional regulator [Nocardia puris]
MRISQLARRSGVPATTLRFYVGSGRVRGGRTVPGSVPRVDRHPTDAGVAHPRCTAPRPGSRSRRAVSTGDGAIDGYGADHRGGLAGAKLGDGLSQVAAVVRAGVPASPEGVAAQPSSQPRARVIGGTRSVRGARVRWANPSGWSHDRLTSSVPLLSATAAISSGAPPRNSPGSSAAVPMQARQRRV